MTLRVLIVDDHQILREGLRSLLEARDDLEVVGEAGDGRDGLAQALALRPDVVVMDVGMRELNGIEATRQIREECPAVRVVVLSTFANERYVLSALEAGASAYVLKIAAHEELVHAIHAVSQGGRFLSPEITGLVVDAGIQGSLYAHNASTPRLTGREREILQLVAEGNTSGEIAETLHLSTRTVEQHRRRMMEKLGLKGIADMTRYAVREGLISADE